MSMSSSKLHEHAAVPGPAAMIVVLCAAGAAGGAGFSLSGAGVTLCACVALLVFGLPHGTLDLEIIRARWRSPLTQLMPLLAVYLGLAAAMFGLWQVDPVVALGSFIAIAVVHFSEDWEGAGSVILSGGLALALLAAPTLLHRAELDTIFIDLTNRDTAVAISQMLNGVAPASLSLGAMALIVLWRNGRRDQAVGGVAALAGMLLFPPIVGFAAYFCLFHSPRHFAHSLQDLHWRGVGSWGRVVIPLTLIAGLLAGVIYWIELRSGLSGRVMTASFMTLSILTVPHMLVPIIVSRLGGQEQAEAV